MVQQTPPVASEVAEVLAVNADAAPAPFSGWRVIIALSVAQGCGIGLLQIYGPFVNPLMQGFHLSAAAVGSGMSIFVVVLTGVGPLLGRYVDRGIVRVMMQAGVVVMLTGLLIVAAASTPWQLAAGIAVASLGIAMFGPIPANVTATHWFTLRRGTAIAVVAAGGAVAGFGLPPLSAWLIEVFGWRTALAGIGTVAAIIALPTLLVGLIPRPEAVGQTPDGLPVPPAVTATDTSPAAGAPRSWLATRDFWLLSVGMSLVLAVPIGLGLYLVPLLVERGMAAPRAALALSVAAVFGFIGTLTAGVLADRFSPKRVLLALVALLAISNASFATWPGFWVAMITAAGMGLGTGGVGPFLPLLVGLRFGAPVVGRSMGVQGIIALPLVAAAPPAAGALRQLTGHYEPAFFCAAAVLITAGVVLALFSVHPPRPDRLDGEARAAAGRA